MHRTAMKLATSLRLKPTTLEVEQPNTVKARGRVRVGEGVRGERVREEVRGGGVRVRVRGSERERHNSYPLIQTAVILV